MKKKIKDLTSEELSTICYKNKEFNCHKNCPLFIKFKLLSKKKCYQAARIYEEKITRRAKNTKVEFSD